MESVASSVVRTDTFCTLILPKLIGCQAFNKLSYEFSFLKARHVPDFSMFQKELKVLIKDKRMLLSNCVVIGLFQEKNTSR